MNRMIILTLVSLFSLSACTPKNYPVSSENTSDTETYPQAEQAGEITTDERTSSRDAANTATMSNAPATETTEISAEQMKK